MEENRKPKSYPAWPFLLGFVLLLAIIGLFGYFSVSQDQQEKGEKAVLEEKVIVLTSLLQKKMVSLCDTTSIETKLKQEEYYRFEDSILQVFAAIQRQIWEAKDRADQEAWRVKEAAENREFKSYLSKVETATKKWQIDNPEELSEYALLKFLESCTYSYLEHCEAITLMEKRASPSFLDYLLTRKEGWEQKEAYDRKQYQAYQATLSQNRTIAEAKLAEVREAVNRLLKNKKTALGI